MEQILLHKFFAGEVTTNEERAVKKWLEESDRNRTIFMRERKVFDAIQLSDTFSQHEQAQEEKQTVYRSLLINASRVASVVLLTLTIAWFFNYMAEGQSYHTVEVPVGHRTNVTLPDGTNVWLNGNTTMTYPLSFGSRERKVTINGEAYFDVAHKRKPFRVKSSKGTVEVLGTQFNICDYSNFDSYIISLIHGKVKVQLADKSAPTTINSGYYVELAEGKLTNPKRIDDYDLFRWKDGLICFKNESFGNIIRSFERIFGVRIQIEGEDDYTGILYTGKFRHEDGVNYALRVLQRDLNFEFERDNVESAIIISN